MSPKMLIYAGVNLHQWAQPPAKRTPAEWSLSLADKSGAGWGLPPTFPPPPPPPPSSLLLLWSLGLNCWLPRRSIGTAGVIESLLLVSDLQAQKDTHTFVLRWGWRFCWAERIKHEIFVCMRCMDTLKNTASQYWLILNYLGYWPMWSLFPLMQVCRVSLVVMQGQN